MIPIADENPLRHRPWLTIAIIIICTLIYLVIQPAGRNTFNVTDPRIATKDLEFSLDWATVPCEITEGRSLTKAEFEATFGPNITSFNGSACRAAGDQNLLNPGKPVFLGLLFSMFLHGSLAHLFGNMLFLWVFGNNIEDSRGRLRFALLYFVGGIMSDLAHILVDPDSTVPVVGASGAIAAVMGAYLALYPRMRIKVITPWMGLRKVSASWVLGLWIASQFLIMSENSGVAWGAHVGGFVVGFLWGVAWRAGDRRSRAQTAAIAPPQDGAVSPAAFGSAAAMAADAAVNPWQPPAP
jgi:membrane associated rhomboid family serine protease